MPLKKEMFKAISPEKVCSKEVMQNFIPKNWKRLGGIQIKELFEGMTARILKELMVSKKEDCSIYFDDELPDGIYYSTKKISKNCHLILVNRQYLCDNVEDMVLAEKDTEYGNIYQRSSMDAFTGIFHECVHVAQDHVRFYEFTRKRNLKANDHKPFKVMYNQKKVDCISYLKLFSSKDNEKDDMIYRYIHRLQISEREAYTMSMCAAKYLLSFLKENDPEAPDYIDGLEAYSQYYYDIGIAKRELETYYDCEKVEDMIDNILCVLTKSSSFPELQRKRIPDKLFDKIVDIAHKSYHLGKKNGTIILS